MKYFGSISESTLIMLQELYKNLRNINLQILSKDETDVSKADLGFRNHFSDADKHYKPFKIFPYYLDANTITLTTDSYMQNYIVVRSELFPDETLSLGPYLEVEPNDYFFVRLMTDCAFIDSSNIHKLKYFYMNLPVIHDENEIINSIQSILKFAGIDATALKVVKPNFNPIPDNNINGNVDRLLDAEIEKSILRTNLEDNILSAISVGDYSFALFYAQKLASLPFNSRVTNSLFDIKLMMYASNTLFRKTVLMSGVHPVYAYEINTKYIAEITNASSTLALQTVYKKMTHAYCLLVQNKGHSKYSPIVNAALSEIDLHLTRKITLHSIAEKLNVNKEYLSRVFHKEVGSTLTNYINNERIHASLKLLITTTDTITDIASSVGIHDVNYYTKLFRKEYGKTPSDYRKEIWGH